MVGSACSLTNQDANVQLAVGHGHSVPRFVEETPFSFPSQTRIRMHGAEDHEAGVRLPFPRWRVGSAAIAHLRACSPPLRHSLRGPRSGAVPAPGANGLQRHLGDAHRAEENRGPGFSRRGPSCPSPADAAWSSVGRVLGPLRHMCRLPMLHITQETPSAVGVHPQRLPLHQRSADTGEDGRSAERPLAARPV